jgi:hypothetical protein
MDLSRLEQLASLGWRFSRDGSTATARLYREDPDDPDSGWELQILKTEGHRPRFTLEPDESGLTERSPEDLQRLVAALNVADELMRHWNGELPPSAD